ncbi:MAG: hypothetical protein FWH05_03660 [Oscillospiraceae bacterium]|nr:hypothetical protein [Oscillospiraceae bacterium]
MIELRLFKNFSVAFDFSFFAIIAVFLAFDYTGYGIYSVIACFLHEMGHLVAMLIEGARPSGIRFYGGGIKLLSNRVFTNADYSIFVLLSGSGLNFILFFLFYFLTDRLSLFPLLFAVMNLVIGFFNLLPMGHLDGKRILERILIKRLSSERHCARIIKITELTVFLSVLTIAVLLVINNNINFTMLIVLAYIFLLELTNS